MLELHEYDAVESISAGKGNIIAVLNDAFNVRVTKEINTSDSLSFEYPAFSPKADAITVNRIIKCEGQCYRVMKVGKNAEAVSVECMHIWYADAPAAHIPTVPDSIGVTPYSFLRSHATGAQGFNAMSVQELSNKGMSWIGKGDLLRTSGVGTGNEFAIDFFAVDKTNLLDLVKTVIDNAGFGEIYYDNNKFAVAEKIGSDTDIRISLDECTENIQTEIDISSMITRIYPYGYEDMTIGSVNGKNYIDSPNASIYGIKSGYKDYSDYTDVNKLFYNACWEFDSDNPSRIDVPSVSVTASAADLSRIANGDFENMHLGDTVTVVDGKGVEMRERITAITYYPYEAVSAELTIGRVKRDLYFYMSQISNMARRYSKCATTSGMISARAISGNTKSSSVQLSSQSAAVKGDEMITVISGNNTRVKIGIADSGYVFKVYDNKGRLSINTDSSQQGMMFSGAQISAPVFCIEYGGGSHVFSADDGGVYIDGRKIVTEETEI